MVLTGKKALLLDMNSTFMFGEDRFSESEEFSTYYYEIGGTLPEAELNEIITSAYKYLECKYPEEKYRHNFPTVEEAIVCVSNNKLPANEVEIIVDTFSFHELGYIPDEYIEVLFKLNKKYILAVVADIWSPKQVWIEAFKKVGIYEFFSAFSFSSDYGVVKPSPKQFEYVVNKLGLQNSECIVIGDSPKRDLVGARAAGIDCILVGGAKDAKAVGEFSSLIELSDAYA